MKRIFPVFLALALLLSGCGSTTGQQSQQSQQPQTQQDASADNAPAEAVLSPESFFSNRDYDSSYNAQSTRIMLEGSTASVSGRGVSVDGSTVTVTAAGTYILTGTLEDGQIWVNVQKNEKVQLVLEDASISSSAGAALYILQADKVFVTLAAGTENSLSSAAGLETADGQNIDGAVYSKEDITFNGAGKLKVTSAAGHGIVSKDSLTVTSGIYEITCASHGLAGKDDVAVADGSFVIAAGKDGIHAENSDDAALGTVYIAGGNFNITAEGDGIDAAAALQIDGGSFTVLTGGGSENGTSASSGNWGQMGGMGGRPGGMGGMGRPGSNPNSSAGQSDTTDSTSMKAVKAGTELVINAGIFELNSADDSIHSNGSVTVTGGSFSVATGDDGFHAEETLTITAGDILITESYEGLEALHILVDGGEIMLTASDDGLNAAGGTDSSGMGGRDGMFGGMGGMSAGNGSVTISDGTLHITASGDGIDANGTLAITGGYITVCGPTQGDTATLDYDTSATITGGTFIGTGASGMAQTFSDSQQGVIAVSAGNQSAGTRILLTDAAGNTIIDHTPELSYNVVILSTPDIIKGESYTITVGDQSGTFEAG